DLVLCECADQLELLLGGVDGLLLLASRRPLASAGLVAAALRGRLMTLGPDDLVFEHGEAAGLFVDPDEAVAVLADAGGWPLLVAYAASTGLPLAAGAVSAASGRVSRKGRGSVCSSRRRYRTRRVNSNTAVSVWGSPSWSPSPTRPWPLATRSLSSKPVGSSMSSRTRHCSHQP